METTRTNRPSRVAAYMFTDVGNGTLPLDKARLCVERRSFTADSIFFSVGKANNDERYYVTDLSLTLEEAEILAMCILHVVKDMREGNYAD